MATALPGVLPPAVVSNQQALQAGISPGIAQDPTNPLNLFEIAGGTALTGKYSTDGGQTWKTFNAPANVDDPNLTTLGNPVRFSTVTNPTIAWDRSENIYISEIERDAANASGALVFQKYTFNTTNGPVSAIQNKVLYRWLNQDPIFNPVIAADDNVPVYNYTDPTNTVNTVQTDTMAGKAVYIAFNTNNTAPAGSDASFNPNTIKVLGSQDAGKDFTLDEFVNDSKFSTSAVSPAHYAAPQMVFTQGSADYGFGPAVVGGQLAFVWNDFGHNTIMLDSSQPDGGVAATNVARDVNTIGNGSNGNGGYINDAVHPSSGPDIAQSTTFTLTVNSAADATFLLSDLTVTLYMIHPHLGQVSMQLVAPNGASAQLLRNQIAEDGSTLSQGVTDAANMGVVNVNWPNGSGSPLYPTGADSIVSEPGIVFDDNAARNIVDTGATAPYTASFKPEVSTLAAAFAGMSLTSGQLLGTWQLKITDHRSDGSTPPKQWLDSWSLNLTSSDISTTQFGTDTKIPPPPGGLAPGPIQGAAGMPYPLAGTGPYGPAGVGPGISIAMDNSLGGLSPYQGRLYIAYTAGGGTNTNVYLTSVDDLVPGTPKNSFFNSPVEVNDDSYLDNFSQGDRAQFMPTVAVDPLTGTVGVMYYDGRWDPSIYNGLSRVGNSFSASLDGGQTFSQSTFLNQPKTAIDMITGKTVTIEPVPGNQAQAGTFGFGDRQGLVMYGGSVYPVFSSNLNAAGASVMTAAVTIAGGPRVLQGDMGPITADSTYTDAFGNVLATYNNTFAPDGTRQLSAFVVQFDRPIRVDSFNDNHLDQVTIYYHDTTTPSGGPGVLIPATHIVPLDSTTDYVLNDFFGSTAGLLATTFEIQFAPQSAVGTYSYAIGNFNGPSVISDGIPSALKPGVPGNYMDQNQNAIIGEGPDYVAQSAVPDVNFDGSSGYNVGDILTVVGGTYYQPAELQVTSTDSFGFGSITGLKVYRPGRYITLPANPVSVTGGGGSGAALDLTFTKTTGDLFAVPMPTDGGPFQLPFSQDTLPLIVPGPHLNTTRIPNSYSVTVPVPISAGTPVVSTRGITDNVNITQLAVELNITYPNMGDLTITLTGPNGNTVPLVNAGQLSGANFVNTTFDDSANTFIYGGAAPYTGRFIPASSLNAVFGDSSLQGDWQLSISGATTAGLLNSWTLLPVTDTNLVLNGTNNALEVQFDRDIQPGSFTNANIQRVTGPNGPLPSYSMATATNIPDATVSAGTVTPGVLTSTISVNDSLMVQGLTVGLNITHPNDADLTATLIAPDGITQIPLFDGGLGANYINTIFDDNATQSIALASGPYTGTYQPAGGVSTVAIAAAGSNYKVGDLLTVSGGVSATPATLQVTSISKTGGITGVVLVRRGMYTIDPASPASVTGGNGTGATFTLTYNNNKLGTLTGTNYLGNWQLVLVDNTPGGAGTLNSWSLNPITVSPNFSVASATVAPGGANYKVGDVLTLVGGIYTSPAQLQVTSVDGSGGITGVAFNTAGIYSTLPAASGVGVTGGSGTGATFNLTFPQGVRSFRINLPTQSSSGTYSIKIGPDSRGNYIMDTSLNSATIPVGDGGSGYAVGDLLQVAGGTFTTPGKFMVTSVSGTGAITRVELVQSGYYTVNPPLLNGVTNITGSGSGAQLALVFGNQVDMNFNAGVNLLYGGDPNNGTVLPNTYASGTINTSIPHGSQISSQINVPDSFVVQGATVTLTIKHQNDPDLTATLVAPDGTAVQLFSHVGNTGSSPHANFTGTTFDDSASVPIQLASTVSGTGIGAGPYNPQFPLSTFRNANALGNWTLQIASNSSTLDGTLVSWSINLKSSVPGSGLGEPAADRITTSFRIFTQAPNQTVAQTQWTAAGPAPIAAATNPGVGLDNPNGSRTGRIGGIAVDPSDPSGNTVFVAGASGGVWKTTDFLTTDPGGPTYVPLTDLGPTNAINVGSIAVFGRNNDPNQSIVFVATGEGDTGTPGVGVLRSMDGGKTWRLLDSTVNVDSSGNVLPINDPGRDHAFDGSTSFRIIVDPKPSPTGQAIVYMALSGNSGGIWRSTDSGGHWTRLVAGPATDVVLAPGSIASSTGNLQILYGAVKGLGVYFTPNAPTASTMTVRTGGQGVLLRRDVDVNPDQAIPVTGNNALAPAGGISRVTLAVPALTGNPLLLGTSAYNGNPLQDTLHEGWIYALVTTPGGNLSGVFESKDFGQNWTTIRVPLSKAAGTANVPTNNEVAGNPNYDPFGNGQNAQGNYDQVLAVDPNNPAVIYIGGSSDFSPYGFIRIDTTKIQDVYAEVGYDNFNNDNGQLQLATTGGVTIKAGGRSFTTGQLLGPGHQYGLLDSSDPSVPARNSPNGYFNLLRDPLNPFLTPSSLQFTNIAGFVNSGEDNYWMPFDGGGLGGTDQHELITMRDPLTGHTRVIFGDDQGIWTGTDNGTGNSISGVGFAQEVNGSRNGNMQITQFYYGAAQPSTLAADIAGALLYGSAQDDGAPVSDPHLLDNGNLNWAGPGGDYAGVATDQTGTGTSYQYAWPCCGATPLPSDFFLVTPPGGSPVSRTTGLLTGGDNPSNQVGEWPYEGTINFAVNPIDPTSIVIGSAASGPGPNIYLTTGPSLGTGVQWFQIANSRDLDGTQSLAQAFGAPADANAPTSDFIYVGTNGGHIFVTFVGGGVGGGASVWHDISAGLDGSPVGQIVTDPVRGTRDAYAVTSTGVFYMADSKAAGATWVNVTGNLFSSALTRVLFDDPAQTQPTLSSLDTIQADWRYAIPDDLNNPTGPSHPVLYVGGNGGVYRSLDKGVTWTYFPDITIDGAIQAGGFLPTVNVTSLNLSIGNINPKTGLPTDPQYGRNMLVAATYGRGTFVIRLNDSITVPGGKPLYTYAVSPVDGPHVTTIQGVPNLANGKLLDGIQVTFSGPVDPATFTLAGINSVDDPAGNPIAVQSVVDITSVPAGQPNPHNVYEIVFATPSTLDGFYRVSLGPKITDFAGDKMDQNENGINGEGPANALQVAQFDVTDASKGYKVGDVLTVNSGTFSVAAQVQVTSVGPTGNITGLKIVQAGTYTALPTNPVSATAGTLTGGNGTGAVLDLAWVKTPGDIYFGRFLWQPWTNSAPVLGTASGTLSAVNEDIAPASNTGESLAAFLASLPAPGITDADTGFVPGYVAPVGVAITGVDDTNGTWQYSTDGGVTWLDIPAVSDKSALLLEADGYLEPNGTPANNWIRFQPNPGYPAGSASTPAPDGSSSFTFRAWDLTSGLDTNGQDGTIGDASINGGTTAFSATSATATIAVHFVNLPPAYTAGNPAAVPEDVTTTPTAYTVNGWVTSFTPGRPGDIVAQYITVPGSVTNPNLFAVQPFVDNAGALHFTLAPGWNGTSQFAIEVQETGGSLYGGNDTSPAQTFTLTVNPPTITLTPTTLTANATAGASYSQAFNGAGGFAPYSNFVTLTGSTLPAGLTLSSAGVLSGTPTQVGTFNFTIQTQDSSQGPSAPYTGSQSYTLTVNPPIIVLSPSSLPGAQAGVTYSQTLTASGGTAPYSNFTISSAGKLPAGLTLSPAGVISGTPTAVGSFTFTVKARDSTTGPGVPYTGSQTYTLSVAAPSISFTPSSLPSDLEGAPYSQTLSGVGGTAPYSGFTITAGSLPTGLTLSAGGVLSGVPTAAGTFNFTIQARDSTTGPGVPYTGSQAYSLSIIAPLAPATLPGGQAGVLYSSTSLTAIAGTGPASSFTVSGGALPGGLTLSSAGVISGTPTAVGSFNFTVSASDTSPSTGAFTAVQQFTITTTPPSISFTPATLTNATAGVTYSQALAGVGGTAPYSSFVISSGALPAGVTLSSTGTLSGTPTAVGSFSFTVTAQDSTTGTGAPFTGSQTFSLVVNPPVIGFTPATLNSATAGVGYSQVLSGTGGTAPYSSFTISAGALPAGLTLSSAGTLSGTPTDVGNFGFTVTAQDSTTGTGAPFTGSQTYSLTVAPPVIVFAPATLPLDVAGTAYTQSLAASGGTAPYSNFTITSGGLPSGITLSSAGVLGGNTSALGNFTFTVQAQDSTTGPNAPYTGSQTFTLQVVEPFTPTALASGQAGVTYSQALSAASGTGPVSNFSISAGSLPAGVTISPGGVISGTPSAVGTFNFTVSANDSTPSNGAFVASQQFTLTVSAPTISISPTTLTAATAGVTYAQTLTAAGGTAPYSSFMISAGALPAGVTLSSAGTLSGTPTAVGSFSFTVTAQDSTTGANAPYTGSQTFSLVVNPPVISFNPAALTAALAGATYSQVLSGTGGTAPYSSFTISAGALPAGLTLSSAGTLSGTPTAVGTFNFTVKAQDSTTGTNAPYTGSQTFSLVVNPPVISFSPASLSAATAGVNYTQSLTAVGGTAPYSSFVISSGALPAGLTLSSAGTLSGTPTAVGSFTFAVKAQDSTTGTNAPYAGTQTFSLTVQPPVITFAPATLSAATAGVAYSQALTVSGGVAPYGNIVLGAGSVLPAGVTLSSGGVLSGTPTQVGSFTVIVQDHDSSSGPNAPYSGKQTYTLTVSAPTIAITPASLAGTTAGAAYSQTLTASGGTAPYSHFTISAGALPAGLTLSSAGTLSGTPTAVGSFSFTVRAQDSTTGPNAPYTGSQAYTLAVAAPTIDIAPGTLPDGEAGAAYSQTLSGTGGTAPYSSFTVVAGSGNLPAGLTLSSGGVLSGTPTAAGTFTFTVQAQDSTSGANAPYTGTHAYTLNIATNPDRVIVNTSALPSAVTDQAVTFTATLTSTGPDHAVPAGTVDFVIDGHTVASGMALSPSGQAKYVATNLTVDGSAHSVSVKFHDSDGLFKDNTGTLPGGQAVVAASTSTTLSSSGASSAYGQTLTFTATVTAQSPSVGTPDGSVTFFVDGVAQSAPVPLDGSGMATWTDSALTASGSPHTIQAVYGATDNFSFSSGTLAGGQSVTKATTSVAVSSSDNPSRPNEPVVFTATVGSANATPSGGTVTFVIDGITRATVALAGNQATYRIATLTVGTKGHTVLAKYNGSTNFAAGSGSMTQVVKAAGTTASAVGITASEAPSFFGDTVTFTAAVTGAAGTPTGVVGFFVDSVFVSTASLDGSGHAEFAINTLKVGSHTIRMSYYGNDTYAAGSHYLTQAVKPAATATAVTSSATPAVLGNPVTFTATVSSGSAVPTGTVTFYVDGVSKATVTLQGGVATYTTSTLALSSTGHTILAKYTATTSFSASSGSLTQVVAPTGSAQATVDVSSSADPSKINTAVTFTATVSDPTNSGTPTGWVRFKVDTTLSPFIPLDASGNASYTVKFTTATVHPVVVTYYGDLNYATAASATFKQDVTSIVPTSLTASVTQPLPTFTLTVKALTSTQSLDSTFSGPVSFTVVSAPPGGTITGTNSTNFVSGVAKFTNLRATVEGTYTLEIVSGDLVLDFTFGVSRIS